MRVLVVESDRGAGAHAARRLQKAGHDVVTCRSPHDPPFPCRGMFGACPLDEEPVDAALLVRGRPWPKPTALEQGIGCILRDRIPLVVTGKLVLDPFDEFATEAVEDEGQVVAALERAADTRWDRLSEDATAELAEGLEAIGAGPEGARAEVVPTASGRWVVTVHVPTAISHMQLDELARRIVRRIHRAQPHPREATVEIVDATSNARRMTARLG